MTKTELIARLAKENAELKDEVADLRERCRNAELVMINIGGPLNDNVLRYSKEQLIPFLRIQKEVSL